MRYQPDHKAATRARILSVAGELFRGLGIERSSVQRIMGAAGLTVGGFYAHFASRETLIAAAIGEALRRSRGRLLEGLLERSGAPFVDAIARRYLSRRYRDELEASCVLPATLSELGRAGPQAREAVGRELETLIEDLAQRVPGASAAQRRLRSIALVALSVGGLSLARAVGGSPLSDEILRACRSAARAGS